MLISELHINNFRSFGADTQSIKIDNLTALIGSNSSGKTSMIFALLRLFGQKNNERTLIKTDFHVSEDENISSIEEMNLFIEAKISFPELKSKNPEEIKTIPEFIKQLIVDEAGKEPYLRMRLVGKWVKGTTPEGNIEQELFYVKVPYGHEEHDALIKVSIHHKRLIQMIMKD
ncbi:AAA family ATPase [Bacillus altitudinis]|uniref:AAA family ATPase n=1 Tax=Bacillus altitudinis TaxID=293387 RepID=UPI0024817237|nr:AAA family ATPase [Bacillus altitudinis]